MFDSQQTPSNTIDILTQISSIFFNNYKITIHGNRAKNSRIKLITIHACKDILNRLVSKWKFGVIYIIFIQFGTKSRL